MLLIESLEHQKSIWIQTSQWLLEVQWKVWRRIHKLMWLNWTLCEKFASWKRRKNWNCFLTANYVAFWETKWVWKLKSVKNWEYKIPTYHDASSTGKEEDEGIKKFPLYWIILNPNFVELHAFIIVWETIDDYICFHQRWDSGIYEATTLSNIRTDWQKRTYHIWYNLDSYAEEYIYINI